MTFQEDDIHVLHSSYTEAVLPNNSLGKTILNCLIQAPEGSVAMVSLNYNNSIISKEVSLWFHLEECYLCKLQIKMLFAIFKQVNF